MVLRANRYSAIPVRFGGILALWVTGRFWEGEIMNIGFTGHRNKIAPDSDIERIINDYPGATWIHGGAEGFDTQIHKAGLIAGKVKGEDLIVICPNFKKYHPKVAPIMRNHDIVDRSDLLVTCWDGREVGGTYSTIQYAISKGKPVVHLDAIEFPV
jgi:hypothetical protein